MPNSVGPGKVPKKSIKDAASSNDKPKNSSKGNKKSKNERKIGKYYGGYGGYKGVRTAEAKAVVNDQIRQQVAPLKNQIRSISQTGARNARGIQSIYGKTEDYLEDRNANTAQAYGQAASQQSAAQAALQAQLGANQAQARGDVSNELMRLGVSDANALSGVNSQTQQALNIASLTGANDAANLSAMAAGANSVGQLFLGSNAGARAAALTENMNDTRDARQEVRNAINDARATRPGLILQLLQQMAQSGWAQHMDQQNLNLARRQQAFTERQAAIENAMQRQAMRQSANGSGGSGGSSGGSSSGGSGGNVIDSEYDSTSNLITGSILGGGPAPKPKPKPKPKRTPLISTANKPSLIDIFPHF